MEDLNPNSSNKGEKTILNIGSLLVSHYPLLPPKKKKRMNE